MLSFRGPPSDWVKRASLAGAAKACRPPRPRTSSGDALILTHQEGRIRSLNHPAQILTASHPLNAVEQPIGLVFRTHPDATGRSFDDLAREVLVRRDRIDLRADSMLISSQGK